MRFAKRGDLRLISHHDLMRTLERALRRARLPVAHSQGFSPRPKITFALALGLGIEGKREVVDIEFSQPLDCAEVQDRLSGVLPPGFDVIEVAPLVGDEAKLPSGVRYTIAIPTELHDDASRALDAFLAAPQWIYVRRRPDRSSEFDLRPHVVQAALDREGQLSFRLAIDPKGSVRPEEFLDALGLRTAMDSGAVLVRDDLEYFGTNYNTQRIQSPENNQKLVPVGTAPLREF